MKSELANKTMVAQLPLVVEIIGPAGAGKTTLLQALGQRHRKIQPGIRISKIRQVPFFINNTFALLPAFLHQYPHSRWFDRRETRSMIYLKAWLHALRNQTSHHDTVTILDHGPIYLLARLREFGPEFTASQHFQEWWTNLLEQWTDTLDIVIWLDAPDTVLLERIRARDRWHAVKDKGEPEAYEFLTGYRRALEQIIAESVTEHQVTLLRFDTYRESVEQIVDKVLTTFDSAPQSRLNG